jgi:hypothetical protein
MYIMTQRNGKKERKKHIKHFAGALRVPQLFGTAWYGYSPWSLGNTAQHEWLKAKLSLQPLLQGIETHFSLISIFNTTLLSFIASK